MCIMYIYECTCAPLINPFKAICLCLYKYLALAQNNLNEERVRANVCGSHAFRRMTSFKRKKHKKKERKETPMPSQLVKYILRAFCINTFEYNYILYRTKRSKRVRNSIQSKISVKIAYINNFKYKLPKI